MRIIPIVSIKKCIRYCSPRLSISNQNVGTGLNFIGPTDHQEEHLSKKLPHLPDHAKLRRKEATKNLVKFSKFPSALTLIVSIRLCTFCSSNTLGIGRMRIDMGTLWISSMCPLWMLFSSGSSGCWFFSSISAAFEPSPAERWNKISVRTIQTSKTTIERLPISPIDNLHKPSQIEISQ